MTDNEDRRLGSSGVFHAIVTSAKKLKRALSESDPDMPLAAEELATKIAQAFIAGRIADVHEMGTKLFCERNPRPKFVSLWRDAAPTPLTGFEIADAGQIDLGYVPGLEEVPQSQFVAFAEIAFSSPGDVTFTIGVVLLDEGAGVRIGAIHAR